MSLLCLATATSVFTLSLQSFTLAWTHSIEKVRWEEDYRIVGKQLEATEARVQGSGAGMEPPPGALLKNGWWHYIPRQSWHNELRLTRSNYTNDYELCFDSRCRSLAELAPQQDGVTRVYPCK